MSNMTPFFCAERMERMNELRIWVTGAHGKLGQNLVSYLSENEYMVLPTDQEVDVCRLEEVMHYGESQRPDVIINCAAITGISKCERHELDAYKVNTLGARNMALVAQRIHAKLIQISTDDVFQGENDQKLNEFEKPQPTTVYGKSKLAGEEFIKELYPKHIIIRSSWLYGNQPGNFLYDLFKQVVNNQQVEVSKEQFSSPTSVLSLCKVIEVLMNGNEYGLFHASCEGQCSRYEFARRALEIAGYSPDHVISGHNEYGQTGNFVLENLMLKMTDIYTMPSWQDDLKNFIEQIKGDLNEKEEV
ncbi:dTDP-4-dehydrorhamnose reductase [Erysipelatoclostridium sp. AM42-17]|nr:dTDP-4-dehydrorhamnose reductase [Erysipelatoclostridium sp. AM42-17]